MECWKIRKKFDDDMIPKKKSEPNGIGRSIAPMTISRLAMKNIIGLLFNFSIMENFQKIHFFPKKCKNTAENKQIR